MAADRTTFDLLAHALREYVEARAESLSTARRELELSELDVRALVHLLDNPGIRSGELGSELGVSTAGITTLTDRLSARGMLRRESDPVDRRAVRLYPTVNTQSRPWSGLTRFDAAVREAIGELGPSVAADFAATLSELTRRAKG